MNTLIKFSFFLLTSTSAFAEWGTEIKGTPNLKSIRLGVRLQGIAEYSDDEGNDVQNVDLFARRTRLQVQTNFYNGWKTYFDLRNDKTNHGADGGEGEFILGDGYIQIPLTESAKLRLFRAKVDMSFSQTVSSSKLIYLERSAISDYASNYVSESRRATNIQLNGTLLDKSLVYQLVIGDGIGENDFEDATGGSANSFISQGPMIGAKLRYYLMGDNPGKLKEAGLGNERYLSLGVGHFNLSDIAYKAMASTDPDTEIDRSLTNIELVLKHGAVTFIAEYFDFDGEVDDFDAGNDSGSSDGSYALLDYFFGEKHSLYVRHETWDRFSNTTTREYEGNLIGYNYYLKGNKIRFGLAYNEAIQTIGTTENKTKKIQTHMMLHF